MRIKRVVIKGFKSFAQPTEFVFKRGMTAIVGPNGCGKSNLADAVRWCLGEQSFAQLRSKKTADVIFAGSDTKPRLNMAAVSLVLDNAAGGLDLDFSEVEITRRAYRDGDNEYLINGQRVRLQDITQLLSPCGLGNRAYAVIGQGLIDRVLSLKEEERRVLFEEAAGITGIQQRRADALRRLEATQQNLARVQDILAALSPRLKQLERQAARARERERVEELLQDRLRTWHGFQWRRAALKLNETRQNSLADQRNADQIRQRLAAERQRNDSMRARQNALRQERDALMQTLEERRRASDKLGRRLAVVEERHRQIAARRDELDSERLELQTGRARIEARMTRLQEDAEAAARRLLDARQRAADAQSQWEARQQERRASEARWQKAQTALRNADGRVAELRAASEQVSSSLSRVNSALQRLRSEAQAIDQEAAHAAASLDAAASHASAADQLLQESREENEARAAQLAALEAKLGPLAERDRRAERAAGQIKARLELLRRLRREGNDVADGVRSILQAARDGSLNGIVGTIASQIEVPARLERAIEVALGGALHHVVATSWTEAQAAIELLKRTRGGRATFLPLDRLRSGEPVPAPNRAGIVGNAAELVRCGEAAAPAARGLLQRVWIAEDLAAARQALDARRSTARPTVVTLDGEIIRPGGAVTGGDGRGRPIGSLLAREREQRELPAKLAHARAEWRRASEDAASLRRRIEKKRQVLAASTERSGALARDARLKRAALEQARSSAAQARQASEWRSQRLRQTQSELAELRVKEGALAQELAAADEGRRAARELARSAAEAAQQPRADDLLRGIADLRAALAAAEGEVNSRRALAAEQKRARQRIDRQLHAKSQRLQELRRERALHRAEIDQLAAAEKEMRADLDDLQRRQAQLDSRLRQLEEELSRADNGERSLQQLLLDGEAAANASRLAFQRAQDRLDSLRREICRDFGLADLEEADGAPFQPPLPWQSLAAQLPNARQIPPGLHEEVEQTRARLRRLRHVNPDAPRDYAQETQRFQRLRSQSDDLENAAQDLRLVIDELDIRVESDLRRAFDAVAAEFEILFRQFMQGGSARLSLTQPSDIIKTGIEISASPPGKRAQTLELLSGGERSLTACALILAILRVSPTPFCVLDEVDATLDEANVDRLCAALDSFAGQTQFIVITHNRRTLEGADGIYGVTMGADGVSRVFSVQLSRADAPPGGVAAPV